jgi:hypothetical protein
MNCPALELTGYSQSLNSELLMCRKFKLIIIITTSVGSLNIRASREIFPIEFRRPEIGEGK